MPKGAKPNSKDFVKEIKEAQKDPNFVREINAFIKAATSIQKLS